MAASVLVLLFTAFAPILGWKFPWVAPHWIAGLVLTVVVIYHIVRASLFQGLGSMWFTWSDAANAWRGARQVLRMAGAPPDKPGKYPLLQRLYHWGVAAAVLAVLASGLLMMVKVDTPFYERNPYWLEARTWAMIYVVHGLAALSILSLIIVHIYFAIRPEKLWITRSMIRGWITRGELLEHHDPEKWDPEEAETGPGKPAVRGQPAADLSANPRAERDRQ